MEKVCLKSAKSNSLIDATKLLLAFFVVAIHSGADFGIIYPLFRLAVPLFFLFTSYFFFSKVNNTSDPHEARSALKSFISRNLKLYLFWLIVQLPLILPHKIELLGDDLITNILIIFRSVLFSSSFSASWYLKAIILDSVLIFFVSRKINTKTLLIFASLIYVVCLMFSTYHGLIKSLPFYHYIGLCFTGFTMIFGSVVNGFPVGLFWMVLGKFLSERPVGSNSTNIFLSVIGSIALIIENLIVQHFGWVLVTDCYIMLVPAAIGIFQLVRNTNMHWKCSVKLRNMSTIIYTTHGSALAVLSPVAIELGVLLCCDPDYIKFILACIACMLLSLIIFGLERYRCFKWLRYSH